MYKKLLSLIIGLSLIAPATTLAAPVAQNFTNIQPFIADTYDNGTSSLEWLGLWTKYASTTALSATTICLTGDTCRTTWPTGGGGGGTFPFTASANYNSTSTPIGFLQGLFSTASSTFNSSVRFSALSDGGLGVNGGLLYSGATTTAGTGLSYSGGAFNVTGLTTAQFASANISQWTNNSGYLTSLAGAASSTLLGDANTFTGVNLFSNASSNFSGTWQTFSPSHFATFGYPFINDATSTLINFSTGLKSASTTLTGPFVFGLATGTSATTTSFFATNASSTNLFGANLSSCTGTNALTWSAGLFSCTAQPQGTVTAVSVATANGFAGSSSGGATPALTLTTSITGLLKGNGTAISAATPGSDYDIFAYPFVYATTYNTLSAGTSTPLWLQGSPFSLFASSTAVFTNASTTQFTHTSTTWFTGITNNLLSTDVNGKVFGSATSTVTCSTGLSCTTFGAITSGAITLLNTIGYPFAGTGNSTSTALGIFASTTIGSGTNAAGLTISGAATSTDTVNNWSGPLSPTNSFVLGTGTTTAWTASTTATAYSPFLVMPFAGTLRQVRCVTDASFLGVNVQVNGSNATPSYFVSSTTVGLIKFTAGNTFTAGQKILANFGTTTSASTLADSCTFDYTIAI